MKYSTKLFAFLFLLFMNSTTSYAGESISTRGGIVSIVNEEMRDGRKKDVLLFNNIKIYNIRDVVGRRVVNFEKQYEQSGKDVLIFSTGDSGLRCEPSYLFLTIYPNRKYKISKDVGNCNGPPVYSSVNNKIIITLPVSSTSDYVVTYDDGKIKKTKVKKKVSDTVDSYAKDCFYVAYTSGCNEYQSFNEVKSFGSNMCLDNITYYMHSPGFNVSGFNKLCKDVSKTGNVVDSKTFEGEVFSK